jgi:hybrid cluster-associated redox disulfide protein
MGITLGMGCGNHGIDVEGMITVLKGELSRVGAGSEPAATPAETGSGTAEAVVTSETLIGTVIEKYPASRPVFEKYFGSGCFDCPGQAYESVDMACRMHGVDPKGVLEEINQALRA